MSLTSAMYTGVSGLMSNGAAMNVIGNNISNVNTVGFKDGRTVFSDLLSQNVGNDSQVGMGVKTQSVQNLFTQGTLQSSTNITDLAIQGDSFFALKSASAASPVATQDAAFLSRAGAFHLDNTNTLVNADGYQVLGTDGKPITFANTGAAPTSDFSKITKIDPNGQITFLATDGVTQNYYNGNGVAPTLVSAGVPPTAGIAVVKVSDPTALTKIGGSLYQANSASGVPAAAFSQAANQPNGVSEQVLSDNIEGSNVDMASEFVNMITTQRAYSANSKTITTVDQMTQEVLGMIR
jgi:flagellar hook protein FlgE